MIKLPTSNDSNSTNLISCTTRKAKNVTSVSTSSKLPMDLKHWSKTCQAIMTNLQLKKSKMFCKASNTCTNCWMMRVMCNRHWQRNNLSCSMTTSCRADKKMRKRWVIDCKRMLKILMMSKVRLVIFEMMTMMTMIARATTTTTTTTTAILLIIIVLTIVLIMYKMRRFVISRRLVNKMKERKFKMKFMTCNKQ